MALRSVASDDTAQALLQKSQLREKKMNQKRALTLPRLCRLLLHQVRGLMIFLAMMLVRALPPRCRIRLCVGASERTKLGKGAKVSAFMVSMGTIGPVATGRAIDDRRKVLVVVAGAAKAVASRTLFVFGRRIPCWLCALAAFSAYALS